MSRIRGVEAVVVAAGLLLVPAGAASGQPGPVPATAGPSGAVAPADRTDGLEWLMREPVTLFDLGVLRLRQDIREVGAWLGDRAAAEERPITGAYWDWGQRRVLVYVTVRDGSVEPDSTACREMFELAAGRLMRAAPQGSRQAQTYLESIFLHEGPGNLARPPAVSEALLDAVRLEVTLLSPAPLETDGGRVRCSARLDADPDDVPVSAGG